MASKNNVFYKLYSSDIKNYVESGYICDNAGNEQGTTFIINDSAGQIVDSKGNSLASIDLSNVGAGGGVGNDAGSPTTGGGITEYTTNTKIIQPHTAYLLQGTDFGLSYQTEFLKIHKDLVNVDYFDVWSNVEFDIQYNSEFHPESCRINTKKYRENHKSGDESFIDIINAVFCEIGLPITVSLENVENEDKCGLGCGEDNAGLYIKFISTSLGYGFNVRNFAIYPIYQDEENPDSPFSLNRITPQDVINAISYVQPTLYKIVDCETTLEDVVEEDSDVNTDERGNAYFRMEEGGENLYMFSEPKGYNEQGFYCWYNNHLFIQEAYNSSLLNGYYCNRIFTTDEKPTVLSDLYYYNENMEFAIYNYATITEGYTENYDTDYWSENTEIDHVINKYHISFRSVKEMNEFRETIRNYHESGKYEQEIDYIKDYIAREAYLSNKSDDVIFEDLERWNMIEEIQEDTYNLIVYIKPVINYDELYDIEPIYDDSSAYRIDCSLYIYILNNLADGIKYVNNEKHSVYNYKATYCYGPKNNTYITRSQYAYGHLIDEYGVVKQEIKCYPIIADENVSSWLDVELGPNETAKLKPGLHAISWEYENKDINPSQWENIGLTFVEPEEGVDYEHVYCHMENDGSITVTVSVPAQGEEGGCVDVTYDPHEIVEIFKQISEITGVYDMNDDGHKVYFLLENLKLRIEPLKYPNGAMRGIIIAPEYPDGYIDECQPLKINHIKDYVDEYEVVKCLTEDGYKPRENEECACNAKSNKFEDTLSKNLLYRKYQLRVLCALQSLEEKRVSGLKFNCGKLLTDMVSPSNDWSFEAQIAPYQQYEELNTMNPGQQDPFAKDSDGPASKPVKAEESWTNGNSEYFDYNNPDQFRDTHDKCCDKNYLGMYGYLRWVEENDMWTQFKTFYGIIAGVDSLDSNDTNLVRSVYLFNPNDIPIKCNYMIFS